jgi:amino-acid N-acetyltransferase
MVSFATMEARRRGALRLFALSTQTSPFFESVCGFEVADRNALPPERQVIYDQSHRQSRVLVKDLT